MHQEIKILDHSTKMSNKYVDYAILCIRVWLAIILLSYGIGKLLDKQFGITTEEMNIPIKDLSLFKVSWYLAAHEPFKSFIGVSQVVAACLLLYGRTAVIGAFVSIPIWLNILIWDLSFMVDALKAMFVIRLTSYLLLTLLIIWFKKKQVLKGVHLLVKSSANSYRYPLWAYILSPLPLLLLECFPKIWNFLQQLLTQ